MSKRQLLLRKSAIIVFAVLGVALLIIAGLGLWDYIRTTQLGAKTPIVGVTVTDTQRVSEVSVTVNDTDYTVPKSQPRAIAIPKLEVSAYVQKVGVDKSGEMSTPNNINFAGWYQKSVGPGQRGVSIINGHAGGRYTQGVFRYINTLVSGDAIRVQMGDLSWQTFQVVSVKTYAVADAKEPLFHNDSAIDEELHLITCDGAFDDKTQSYDQRTIVVAKLAP